MTMKIKRIAILGAVFGALLLPATFSPAMAQEEEISLPKQDWSFSGPFGGVPGTRHRAKLEDAELSSTAPEIFEAENSPRFAKLAQAVKRVSWGGDGYAYGLLALGQIDVIAEATLKIWDWAALVPVIEGAGGSLTDWNGHHLREDGDGRALAVGDPALVPEIVAALR